MHMVKIAILRDVTPCCVVEVCEYFKGACCLDHVVHEYGVTSQESLQP
jgi:hypothetical protein